MAVSQEKKDFDTISLLCINNCVVRNDTKLAVRKINLFPGRKKKSLRNTWQKGSCSNWKSQLSPLVFKLIQSDVFMLVYFDWRTTASSNTKPEHRFVERQFIPFAKLKISKIFHEAERRTTESSRSSFPINSNKGTGLCLSSTGTKKEKKSRWCAISGRAKKSKTASEGHKNFHSILKAYNYNINTEKQFLSPVLEHLKSQQLQNFITWVIKIISRLVRLNQVDSNNNMLDQADNSHQQDTIDHLSQNTNGKKLQRSFT